MKEEIYKNYNLTADDIVQISQDVYEFRANNKKYVAIRGIYNTEQINQSFIIAKYLREKNGVESLRLMPVLGNSFNLIILENSINNLSIVDLPEIEKYHKTIFYNKRVLINWANNWETTIDKVEEMLNQKNIVDIDLLVSINYFIGIGEMGIALFNEGFENDHYFTVCHRKINNDKYCLVNPLNYIWDYECRDYAEYIKYKIINNMFSIDDISYLLLTKKWAFNHWKVLLSRIMFCDDFFESLMKYLNDSNNDIKKYLQIANIYESAVHEIIDKLTSYFKIAITYY